MGKNLSALFFVMCSLVAVAGLSQSDLFRTIGGNLIEIANAKDNSGQGNYRRQGSYQGSNQDQRSNTIETAGATTQETAITTTKKTTTPGSIREATAIAMETVEATTQETAVTRQKTTTPGSLEHHPS